MRLLSRMSPRFWNRLLAAMLLLFLLVVGAGVIYDHARFDALLQGKLNIDHAQINANGLTLAQAEADIARVLNTDRADITALQQKVAALQAQDAQLQQEIAALQVALGSQASTPSGSAPGPTAAPTTSPLPSSKPTPPPHPNHQAGSVPTPVVCISILCLGAQPNAAACTHAAARSHHCPGDTKP